MKKVIKEYEKKKSVIYDGIIFNKKTMTFNTNQTSNKEEILNQAPVDEVETAEIYYNPDNEDSKTECELNLVDENQNDNQNIYVEDPISTEDTYETSPTQI